MLRAMYVVGSAKPDWIGAIISGIVTAALSAIALVIKVLYRRLRSRKEQDARRDDPVARPQARPSTRRLYVRRNPSHVPVVAQRERVSAHGRIFRDTPPKLTTAQKADLIEREMPERLVRNGDLDYESLTSGSMSDRIRNGCC